MWCCLCNSSVHAHISRCLQSLQVIEPSEIMMSFHSDDAGKCGLLAQGLLEIMMSFHSDDAGMCGLLAQGLPEIMMFLHVNNAVCMPPDDSSIKFFVSPRLFRQRVATTKEVPLLHP